MDEHEYSSEASSDDDDIELDVQDDDPSSPSTSSALDTEIIEPAALKEEINRAVDKSVAVLGFAPDVVKALLNSFSWDSDKLFEKFYEAESPEAFFKKQKINIPDPNQKGLDVKEGDCQICFEWKNNLVGFSCHHFFCSDCWNSYLLARIRSEGDPYCFCPEPGCHIPINEENVIRLLKSSTEQDFFKNLLVQTFVNSNAVLRWCPSDKCDKVVKVKTAEFGQVSCSCGTSFCFLCSQEWHEPMTCSLLARWIKKYSGDSESMKWVSVNTKDCPKCNAAIEKNGGCNHMVCRNKHCNYEFCWFCMKDWKVHGYDNNGCNRFREENSTDKVNDFREQLRRYMHYYDRFANHRKSLQAENELLLQISLKIETMQDNSFSWIETDCLRAAAQILQRCRRILMFTYAFAYYLPKNNEKEIFEDNQADLERSVEELSGLLEREIDYDKMDIPTLKQKIQDLNSYVDKRRLALIQHCEEGIEKGFWKFTSDE